MLITTSLAIFMLTIAALIIFFRYSYIKTKSETIWLIVALFGWNITCFAVNMYFAKFGSGFYMINRFVFISDFILSLFRNITINLYGIFRIANIGRFMFIIGIFLFMGQLSEKKGGREQIVFGLYLLFTFLIYDPDIYLAMFKAFLKMDIQAVKLQYAFTLFDNILQLTLILCCCLYSYQLIVYARVHRSTRVMRSINIFLVSIVLILIEFITILNFNPFKAMNTLNTTISVNSFLAFVLDKGQKHYISLYLAVIFLLVFSYSMLLYSSFILLSANTYEKLGYMMINKRIAKQPSINFTPFLHSLKNKTVLLNQYSKMIDKENIDELTERMTFLSADMLSMIDRLYRQSKELQLQLFRCDINEILVTAVHLSNKEGVPIVYKPCHDVFVMADRKYLVEALINVLNNSTDACAGKPDALVMVTLSEQKKWIQISIRDNGYGIQKEFLTKIFDPFFSTKNKPNHWGMGLTYAHRILIQHGGKIMVKSEFFRGAEFILYLLNEKKYTVIGPEQSVL